MKKLLIAAAFMICANIVNAQTEMKEPQAQDSKMPNRPPDDPRVIMEQAKKETDKMDKELKLSAEQKRQVMDINLHIDQEEAIVKEHEKNPEHLKQLEMNKIDQYRRLLNREQMPKFERMIHQSQMPQPPMPPTPPQPGMK